MFRKSDLSWVSLYLQLLLFHINQSINPCHAESIKGPRPLQVLGQSDYLIQVVDTNSHTS